MRRLTIRVVLQAVLLLFILYAVYNIATQGSKLAAKQEEYATLEAQITEQKLENQRMEETIGDELDDDEIASVAREKLGYALPGERVFIDITGK